MTKSIRALDRGLVVLELLDRQGATSLAGLSRATGLSKATLLRVLQTLVERGWAYRRVNDGCYALAIAPGSAFDDGFLTSPELSELIIQGQEEEFVPLYRAVNLENRQHWIDDRGNIRDLFGAPREIQIGVKLDF